MRNRQRLRRTLFIAALATPIGFAGVVHAAGLFDAIGAIFGAEPEPPRYERQPPYGYDLDDGGLDMTVRPRRQQRRERPEARRDKPTLPSAELDPARNPNWYLQDPTLRQGDIVVLKGEVLVFQGGRLPYSRKDFSSLDQSKLPKADRERIGAMAGLAAAPPTERLKTATAVVERSQPSSPEPVR